MVWDIVVCGLGWSIIACHAWSVKHHFAVEKMPAGARVISIFVILSGIFLTYTAFDQQQPLMAQATGTLLLLLSMALFWLTIRESAKANLLAAFDEKLPHGLLQTGPYRYVRHPFYTSYILQWLGWGIGVWSPWAIVPFLAMTTVYWVAARDEEAKFLRTAMSDEYKAYIAKTGRFFPKISS